MRLFSFSRMLKSIKNRICEQITKVILFRSVNKYWFCASGIKCNISFGFRIKFSILMVLEYDAFAEILDFNKKKFELMQMNLKSVNDSLATKKYFAFKFQNCVHFLWFFFTRTIFHFKFFTIAICAHKRLQEE